MIHNTSILLPELYFQVKNIKTSLNILFFFILEEKTRQPIIFKGNTNYPLNFDLSI